MPALHPIGFRLDGIAPVADIAWTLAGDEGRKAFWAAVADLGHAVKDRSLARGLDKDGDRLAKLKPYTIAHRRSAMGTPSPTAPPLTPAYGLSRTRSLLRATAIADGVWFDWRHDAFTGDSWGVILDYHARGLVPGAPARDVIGLSAEDKAEIGRKALVWWTRNRRRLVARAIVGKLTATEEELGIDLGAAPKALPKPKVYRPPVAPLPTPTGGINLDLATFHTGDRATLERLLRAGAKVNRGGVRAPSPGIFKR